MKPYIQVSAAIIHSEGKVLVSSRLSNKTFSGFSEFPGGKIEQGETPEEALERELYEELNIHPIGYWLFAHYQWEYEDVHIEFYFYEIKSFNGAITAKEGQGLKWVEPLELESLIFPAANMPVIQRILLPSQLAISRPSKQFYKKALRCLTQENAMLRLRNTHDINLRQLSTLAKEAKQRKKNLLIPYPTHLQLSCLGLKSQLGIHLTSRELNELSTLPKAKLIGASAHNQAEMERALSLGCHYICLSPVQNTKSHPNQKSLGWDLFQSWVAAYPLPVYALGGLKRTDLTYSILCGAQGVAAITAFWDNAN